MQLLHLTFELDGIYNFHAQVGTEADGLGAHLFHELRAHDSLLEARVVLYLGGVHEFATVLKALEDEGIEFGACCVERCGIAGRAGADDGDIVDSH